MPFYCFVVSVVVVVYPFSFVAMEVCFVDNELFRPEPRLSCDAGELVEAVAWPLHG